MTPKTTAHYRVMLSSLAVLIGLAIGSPSLHAACTTPQGFSSPDHRQSLTQISQLFNVTLTGRLKSKNLLDKVIILDLFILIDDVVNDFQDFGFQLSNNGMACNAQTEMR